MGFTAEQVDRMSLWQFNCACEGWVTAHGAEDLTEPEMTFTEFRKIMDAPLYGLRN